MTLACLAGRALPPPSDPERRPLPIDVVSTESRELPVRESGLGHDGQPCLGLAPGGAPGATWGPCHVGHRLENGLDDAVREGARLAFDLVGLWHLSDRVRGVSAIQHPPQVAQGTQALVDGARSVRRAGPPLSISARLGQPPIPLRPDLVWTNGGARTVADARDPFLNVLAALLDRRERRHALEVAVSVFGEGRLAQRGERRSDARVEADPVAPASPVGHQRIRRKRRGEEPGPVSPGAVTRTYTCHLPEGRRRWPGSRRGVLMVPHRSSQRPPRPHHLVTVPETSQLPQNSVVAFST